MQTETMTTKPCARCRIPKPLDDFAIKTEKSDGRDTQCKECERKERARKKAQEKEYGKKYFIF